MKDDSGFPYVNCAELREFQIEVENSMIEGIEISLLGHFGNIVTVEVRTSHGVLFQEWNATAHLGLVLRCLFDLLDLTEEDGRILSDVRSVPCRILKNRTGMLIGIGHFMKDKFVTEQDLFQFCKRAGGEQC